MQTACHVTAESSKEVRLSCVFRIMPNTSPPAGDCPEKKESARQDGRLGAGLASSGGVT